MIKFDDFDSWIPLSKLSLSDIPQDKDESFVYIFRRQSTKKVIYIGGTSSLQQRMFKNYIGGTGGGTTQRIHDLLLNKGEVWDTEVAWRPSKNHREDERILRQVYRSLHGNLPEWNRQS